MTYCDTPTRSDADCHAASNLRGVMHEREVAAMRDAAVRVELTMTQSAVAMLAGVCRPTIARFEREPLDVIDPTKRAAIAAVYAELRRLLTRRAA